MAEITLQEQKKIEYFRKLFPKSIEVKVNLSEEGGYWVEILTFPGCFTQAETFAELIEMVNDAVVTVLEVPRKYLSYMPTYMPPLSLAQRFNIFPFIKVISTPIVFSIP